MKLKEFNPENCIPEKSGKSPMISMSTKSGVFSFNRPACLLMGLKSGDHVVMHQDEETPENWYLEKVGKGKGWEIRGKADENSALLFNNAKLAREIAGSVEFKKISGRMLVAGQPTKYEKRQLWGVLTVNLKND